MSDLGQNQIFSSEEGVSREGLSFEKIANFYIIIPPIVEQKNISKYIEKEINNYNNLIRKIQKENELLEEYKQSLIYNVVTGKVKVEGE